MIFSGERGLDQRGLVRLLTAYNGDQIEKIFRFFAGSIDGWKKKVPQVAIISAQTNPTGSAYLRWLENVDKEKFKRTIILDVLRIYSENRFNCWSFKYLQGDSIVPISSRDSPRTSLAVDIIILIWNFVCKDQNDINLAMTLFVKKRSKQSNTWRGSGKFCLHHRPNGCFIDFRDVEIKI